MMTPEQCQNIVRMAQNGDWKSIDYRKTLKQKKALEIALADGNYRTLSEMQTLENMVLVLHKVLTQMYDAHKATPTMDN